MEEEKREESHLNNNSSSTSTTPMAFSDEIPSISMNMSASITNLSFPFQPASMSAIFDMVPPSSPSDQKASSFGFVDLMGIHDYNPSLFDWLPIASAADHHPLPSPASSSVPDSSEVLNTPASPNSSSISSSSNDTTTNKTQEQRSGKPPNEAEDDGGNGGGGDDKDQDKSKKQ